eukprot:4002871-Karenia_brevis.AAC.1
MMTYDFKAAFTSLSQKRLYEVLNAMQVPIGLMQLLVGIYNAARIHFCAFGKSEYVCKATSGVIQGCPLSGTLFVLATQPILAQLHEA